MTTRSLTDEERTVLAARHIDPDAWWAHAQAHFASGFPDSETVIVAQLEAASAEIARQGAGYKPRAQVLAEGGD